MFPYHEQEDPRDVRGRTEGESWYIRKDLAKLVDLLGKKTLRELLKSYNIRRCLEVGIGEDFGAIKSLADLRTSEGTQLLNSDDLWAVDPLVDYAKAEAFLQDRTNITLVDIPAESVAESVALGLIKPFDLVFSKGVASIGAFPEENPMGKRTKALQIIETMKATLNPNNANALLMLGAYYEDTVLPYWQGDLEQLGLKVISFIPAADENTAKSWIKLYQSQAVFPFEPNEMFYNFVVCQQI